MFWIARAPVRSSPYGGHKEASLLAKDPNDFCEQDVDVIREVDLGLRGENFLRPESKKAYKVLLSFRRPLHAL
jgi:hypothetical protein